MQMGCVHNASTSMERDRIDIHPFTYKMTGETTMGINVFTADVLRCSVDAVTPLMPSLRTTALDGGSVDGLW